MYATQFIVNLKQKFVTPIIGTKFDINRVSCHK